MRILGLVDLHWRGQGESPLRDLHGYDLVLLGGDFTHFGGVDLARRLIEPLRQRGVEVRAVCGNCDRPEVDDWLAAEGIGLDGRVEEFRGVRLMGLSGSLPFDGCPYERTEAEYEGLASSLAGQLDGLPPLPTILVSHQPPRDTACDRVRSGAHVGSTALRRFIEEHQPDLVLCGHIHESPGTDDLGSTRVVNPGPAGRGGRLEVVLEDGRLRLVPGAGFEGSPAPS